MPSARLAIGSGLSAALAALGCATQVPKPLPPPIPRSTDDSLVCKHLEDHFIGLPAKSKTGRAAPTAPTPFTGRWWVRSCSAVRQGGALELQLRGPGWYFVDDAEGGLALHQQVPFELELELDVRPHAQVSEGIVSLWLEPSKQPRIEVSVAGELDVQGRSAWGQLLRAMPFSPVKRLAAKRFTDAATLTLRYELREGATFTYEMWSGQADATLGKLPPGELPHHSFDDGEPWLANERVLLAEGGSQVIGPLAAGVRQLDVQVERGAGVGYSTVCTADMAQSYPAIASGKTSDVPGRDPKTSGSLAGAGEHSAALRVDRCSFYLLLTGLRGSETLAAVRVRE